MRIEFKNSINRTDRYFDEISAVGRKCRNTVQCGGVE